jgi:hypothetical protein
MEMYEGMLVQYVNPAKGGKIHITVPKPNNFADYWVSTDPNYSQGRSGLVQAGRQNSSNFSSLYVSVVADTIWKTQDGQMEVPAVVTKKGQSMDTLIGVFNYGFSQYKLLPRNNDDFRGFSVALEKAKYPAIPGSGAVKTIHNNVKVLVFPNPTKSILNIELEGYNEQFVAGISDLNGKVLLNTNASQINIEGLATGIYYLSIHGVNGELISVSKVVKQ